MKLVMYHSEKADSAFKATLRKISCALKAERDVGTRRGRWSTQPSDFLTYQLTLSQPGEQIMPLTLLVALPDL